MAALIPYSQAFENIGFSYYYHKYTAFLLIVDKFVRLILKWLKKGLYLERNRPKQQIHPHKLLESEIALTPNTDVLNVEHILLKSSHLFEGQSVATPGGSGQKPTSTALSTSLTC